MFNILYFELISLSRFKKDIYFTGYKRSDTTQSVQSVEELIVEEDPKPDHQEDAFKKPGTNAALRRASTVSVAEGPPGGPPNVKRMSCVDEEPKARQSTGGISCFKDCFRSNRTNSIVEINS